MREDIRALADLVSRLISLYEKERGIDDSTTNTIIQQSSSILPEQSSRSTQSREDKLSKDNHNPYL